MTVVSQPSPLSAARQHAQAYAAAGNLTGARATLHQAIEAARATLGEDDPAVLAAAHQLAEVHRQAGDPAAARRVLEETFAAGQWRLGDADPLMLAVSFDLGLVAEELGNRHEARRAFGRVATLGPPVLGEEHWAVTQARAYLGEEPATVRTDEPAPDIAPTAAPPTPAQTPAPQPMPATAWTEPHRFSPAPPPGAGAAPAAPSLTETYPGRGRGPLIFAGIAAGLAAVIAVVALVVVLATRNSDQDGPPGVPTLAGPPPTDVRLRDNGSTVEVSWQDPTDGTVSFVVMGGRTGEQLRVMARLGPGQTEHRLDGLNARLDYCFAVVALYSSDKVSASAPSCTDRDVKETEPSPGG